MNHFFALELPESTRRELAAFVERWKLLLPSELSVRWYELEGYHLTLNF